MAYISKEEYKNDEEWKKKHPELRRGCFAAVNRDGEIVVRIERLMTDDYIPAWYEVPYPDYLQKEIIAPMFTISADEDIIIPLEWI